MAFIDANLRLVRDLGPMHIYHYITADAHATVDSAAYFNVAKDKLAIGDIIEVVVVDSTTAITSVTTYGRHIVLSNDGTNVDVSDVTVGTMTDTD